jgi:hypothetical protein
MEHVDKLRVIILEMKQLVKQCEALVKNNHAQDRGDYQQFNSILDYIRYMTTYTSMHEQEYQMKYIIVQSLHEEESPFVLNTYMISWKKQPFRNMDVLRGMEMEWNRDEKMRAKLGLVNVI